MQVQAGTYKRVYKSLCRDMTAALQVAKEMSPTTSTSTGNKNYTTPWTALVTVPATMPEPSAYTAAHAEIQHARSVPQAVASNLGTNLGGSRDHEGLAHGGVEAEKNAAPAVSSPSTPHLEEMGPLFDGISSLLHASPAVTETAAAFDSPMLFRSTAEATISPAPGPSTVSSTAASAPSQRQLLTTATSSSAFAAAPIASHAQQQQYDLALLLQQHQQNLQHLNPGDQLQLQLHLQELYSAKQQQQQQQEEEEEAELLGRLQIMGSDQQQQLLAADSHQQQQQESSPGPSSSSSLEASATAAVAVAGVQEALDKAQGFNGETTQGHAGGGGSKGASGSKANNHLYKVRITAEVLNWQCSGTNPSSILFLERGISAALDLEQRLFLAAQWTHRHVYLASMLLTPRSQVVTLAASTWNPSMQNMDISTL